MTDPRKIEKLLFILAIAVCWAYKIGELQARKVPITIKKHGRKLKSIFRLGLDLIRRVLFREDPDFIEGLTVFPYLGLVGRGPLYEIIFCRVQREFRVVNKELVERRAKARKISLTNSTLKSSVLVSKSMNGF